ncbi:MAG: Gfo/Idh/MocA family oxidoreductase [Clostridiales bacterium]|nr:Gfo/Idh/MocA family oxidoreductase [Clostridiales bacterium]
MSIFERKVDVLVVGGGMISQEVILPTLFQEQRYGRVGNISISALTGDIITKLRSMFPKFKGYPDPDVYGETEKYPDMFKQAIADLPPDGVVIVATPDHLHTPVILAAIEAGRHVIVEKPLCLKVNEAKDIIKKAHDKGVYVLTDYHKRHDRSIRAARYKYRNGDLGEMLHSHAWIEEPKYMALNVFKDWCEKSSSFEYIGVHYADAYYFITGLKPKRLVAFGQKKFLPTQGKNAYDAVQATIVWEDDSVQFIQTSWVNNPKNSAMTNQGMMLLGTMGEYWGDHKARNTHFVTDEKGYEDYNPNFFKQYDSWDFPGDVDNVGYGYDSIVQGINDIKMIMNATEGMSEEEALLKRREMLEKMADTRGLPEQALVGVAINNAVRMSVDNGSRFVVFDDELNISFE